MVMVMASVRVMGLLWITAAVFVVLAAATPRAVNARDSVSRYDYGFVPCIAELENQTPFVVSGVGGGDGLNATPGALPSRLEVRQLQDDKRLWTLYLLGLDLMQSFNQTNLASWFQIAGIHGRPYQPWDGVQATADNGKNGYCTHVSILFPTWHRPYLALYEQILYAIIQEIVSYYEPGPVQDAYAEAASRFRIPYWDWAATPASGQSVLPDSVGGSPTVLVDGPYGTQKITNPLFSYHFNPLDPNLIPDYPFNQWPETLRNPANRRASAISRNALVAQTLKASLQSFRSRLYNLLTNYHRYSSFSNEAFMADLGLEENDSIESLHDQIHGITGSGGHMTYVDYSAFDPIFVLHHTMVDRCFALWQVVNPDSFVLPQQSMYPTFTISSGVVVDDSTALTPFRRDAAGTFWTSSSARYTETFGYTYPETTNPQNLSPAQMKSKVVAAINNLYGSPVSKLNSTKRSTLMPHGPIKRSHKRSNTYQEWIANLLISKSALTSPITIYLLLGPAPQASDPLGWSLSPHLVGSQSVFKHNSPSHSNAAPQKITAVLPLTAKILEKVQNGEIASPDEQIVEAYLRSHLRYRVVGADGSELGSGTAKRASSGIGDGEPLVGVMVASAMVTKAASEREFPVWGPLRGRFEVDGGN